MWTKVFLWVFIRLVLSLGIACVLILGIAYVLNMRELYYRAQTPRHSDWMSGLLAT
jgi:hypothetical protein